MPVISKLTNLDTLNDIISAIKEYADKRGYTAVSILKLEDNSEDDIANTRWDVEIVYLAPNNSKTLTWQKLLYLKGQLMDAKEFHARHNEFYPKSPCSHKSCSHTCSHCEKEEEHTDAFTIIEVEFPTKNGGYNPHGRKYNYVTLLSLCIGDEVFAPTRFGNSKARVTRVNVPLREIYDVNFDDLLEVEEIYKG
jgi:hypothetical protein